MSFFRPKGRGVRLQEFGLRGELGWVARFPVDARLLDPWSEVRKGGVSVQGGLLAHKHSFKY